MLILLDNLSYNQPLLDIFFDSQLNYLFFVFADGKTDTFHFEIQNIHQIIFSEADYRTNFSSKDETHIAILNSIQMNIHFLESNLPGIEEGFPLSTMRSNYWQGFNNYNDFEFFKNNNVVFSSDFNDYLMYHSMFFYNNFSSSFVDFDALQHNSRYVLKDLFQIYSTKNKETGPKIGICI